MRITRLPHKLRRFGELNSADKWLLLRAVFWLGVARIWLVVVPFGKLAERLSMEGGTNGADPEVLERVKFAVSAAGANVPWRSDCFPQSIGGHRLLKSYGYSSTIHLGVEKGGEGELLGHAWLTCGETVVTGGDQLDRYVEIHRLGE